MIVGHAREHVAKRIVDAIIFAQCLDSLGLSQVSQVQRARTATLVATDVEKCRSCHSRWLAKLLYQSRCCVLSCMLCCVLGCVLGCV